MNTPRLANFVILCVVVVASSFAGCGGGGGGNCGKVQPCGGDIVGNWKVSTVCTNAASASMPNSFCPEATSDVSGFKVTGTVAYRADLTYTVMISGSGSVKATFPAACLTQPGVAITCQDLNTLLGAASATSGAASVNCTAAGTGCACTFVAMPQNQTESGTYTTAGTTISDMPAGGTPEMLEYCVQGNTAHFINVDMAMSMGMMGKVVIASDLTATR